MSVQLVTFAVCSLLAIGSARANTSVSDVKQVARIAALIEEVGVTSNRAAVLSALDDALWRSIEGVLRDSNIVDVDQSDIDELRVLSITALRTATKAAFAKEGVEQQRALHEILRKVTTRAMAEQLVEHWLGLAPLEASPSPEVAPLLAGQITATDVTGDVRLRPEQSRVITEVGGAGRFNRLIDAGEWVLLSLVVANDSPRAWFSTSAFVEADGACLWSDPEWEYELEEMPKNGLAAFSAWVYVAEQCNASSRPLRIRLKDTRRATGTGIVLQAQIKPIELAVPTLTNIQFDTDQPGASDGSNRKEVGPGLRFELSADVSLSRGEAVAAVQRFSIPTDLKELFPTFEVRIVPMERVSGREFKAADDLDASTVGEEQFRSLLKDARPSQRWVQKVQRSRLWVAIETELHAANPLEVAPMVESKVATAPVKPPPSVKVVLELIRANLALKARPAETLLPGGLQAANGYEVVFDAASFEKAYALLTGPSNPAAPTPKEPTPLVYRFRHYQALPLAFMGYRQPKAETLSPEPMPEPIAEPATERLPWRIDLHGNLSLSSTLSPKNEPNYWLDRSTVAILGGQLQASYGRTLFATSSLSYGAASAPTKDVFFGRAVASTSEFRADLGVGYRLVLGERFELDPSIRGVFRYRAFSTSQFSVTSGHLAFRAGLTARMRISDSFGVATSADIVLGPNSPTLGDAALIDGMSFIFGVGGYMQF